MRGHGGPRLLRENREFRRFWLGQSMSLLGDQVSVIALPLVAVLVLDATPLRWATSSRPNCHRTSSSRSTPAPGPTGASASGSMMIATDLGRAVLIGSIPLAYAFDALTFPHMLVVAFLMGTLSVLFHVSYSSLFVALVPRDRFVEGGSIMTGAAPSRTSSVRASAACSCRCSRRP